MIVKKGTAEIIDVIRDDEHAIDDEGTRKAMERAAEPTELLAMGNDEVELPLDKKTEMN